MRLPVIPACIALACLVAVPAPTLARSCPDTDAYSEAREVIEDLGRITAPNGIQTAYSHRIGGIEQWIHIRGQDRANPIILSIHGGPAAPLIPGLWQFQRPLEEYFTLVNYDQRGAGRSFVLNDPDTVADSIRIERYVDDAIEIAEHILATHGEEKLILMGHSWGTVIGMHAALKRPDLFHAYVGIGQVINTRENEELSFAHGLSQARAAGNQEAVAALEAIAPYPGDQPLTRERIVTARNWAQHYGGLSAFRDSSMYYFRAPRLSPDYGPEDVCAINQGSLFTLERLLEAFLEVDFTAVSRFPIPVVMFMGRHDYSTPSEPTARWLEQVEAPYKRGIWFENASHMVQWEEPGKTLVSLLEHVRPLARPAPERTPERVDSTPH